MSIDSGEELRRGAPTTYATYGLCVGGCNFPRPTLPQVLTTCTIIVYGISVGCDVVMPIGLITKYTPTSWHLAGELESWHSHNSRYCTPLSLPSLRVSRCEIFMSGNQHVSSVRTRIRLSRRNTTYPMWHPRCSILSTDTQSNGCNCNKKKTSSIFGRVRTVFVPPTPLRPPSSGRQLQLADRMLCTLLLPYASLRLRGGVVAVKFKVLEPLTGSLFGAGTPAPAGGIDQVRILHKGVCAWSVRYRVCPAATKWLSCNAVPSRKSKQDDCVERRAVSE